MSRSPFGKAQNDATRVAEGSRPWRVMPYVRKQAAMDRMERSRRALALLVGAGALALGCTEEVSPFTWEHRIREEGGTEHRSWLRSTGKATA